MSQTNETLHSLDCREGVEAHWEAPLAEVQRHAAALDALQQVILDPQTGWLHDRITGPLYLTAVQDVRRTARRHSRRCSTTRLLGRAAAGGLRCPQ